MDRNASHSCPNCEYEHGTSGNPVSSGDVIKCLACGTSWKEFSGTAIARNPKKKRTETVDFLRKMARNDQTEKYAESVFEAQTRNHRSTGYVGAFLFIVLMVGGTLFTGWILNHTPNTRANAHEVISISDVKLREQVGRDGKKVITVRGNINNKTQQHHAVPKVAIILKRKDGGEIVRWHYNPPSRSITPGGKTQFASSIQYDTPIIAYAEAIIE